MRCPKIVVRARALSPIFDRCGKKCPSFLCPRQRKATFSPAVERSVDIGIKFLQFIRREEKLSLSVMAFSMVVGTLALSAKVGRARPAGAPRRFRLCRYETCALHLLHERTLFARSRPIPKTPFPAAAGRSGVLRGEPCRSRRFSPKRRVLVRVLAAEDSYEK